MIQTETIIINGKEYKRTYSDAGYAVERDGVIYEEAIDPIDSDREYTESDVLLDENGEISDTEALEMITEEVTDSE